MKEQYIEKNLVVAEDFPDKLKRTFAKAWTFYDSLHSHKIELRHLTLNNVSMRAQPKLNLHFFSKKRRQYKIEIQNRPQFEPSLKMEDLPEDVLIGWFAHELGHIKDYLNRSWLNLIKMGIGYLAFPAYKIGVERRADIIALEHGCVDYIQATKRFILEKSNIPDKYLGRINKYYLSPEEIEEIVLMKDKGNLFRDKII